MPSAKIRSHPGPGHVQSSENLKDPKIWSEF